MNDINDFTNIQTLFQKYIVIENKKVKDMLIDEYKKKLPQSTEVIDYIKSTIDGLGKEEQKLFIANAFNKGIPNMELVDNLHNQLVNKTIHLDEIKSQIVDIISFYNFEKDKTTENCGITNNKIIMNDNSQKTLIEMQPDDTYFYSYLIEKFVNKNLPDFLLVNSLDKKYIASDYELPKIGEFPMIKEEAFCDLLRIKDKIDKIIENKDSTVYLRRIFMDIITNQNYREITNGLGVIKSDVSQNTYYALNGVTFRKEFVIESFLKNYYDSIKDIVNLIADNFRIIENLVNDMIKSGQFNKNYLLHFKDNIKLVYEKIMVKRNLDAIEFGEEEDIDFEKRNLLNGEFEININNLRKSLGLNNQNLNKVGYVSIFTIISGIIIFGVLLAYLILQK